MKKVFKQVEGLYYSGGSSIIGVNDVVELRTIDAGVRRLKVCSTRRTNQLYVNNTLCGKCCFFNTDHGYCPIQTEEVHRMRLPDGSTKTHKLWTHTLLCSKARRKRDHLVWFEDMDNYLEEL